ncbi:MAG: hypothetical protein ACI9FJ_002416 [Alteromonadaceae bacterium]
MFNPLNPTLTIHQSGFLSVSNSSHQLIATFSPDICPGFCLVIRSHLIWDDFVDELNHRLAQGVKVAQTQLVNGQYSSFENVKKKVEDIKR